MTLPITLPAVIQGGMGIGVSGWQLARAVSSQGQLGVVSGTAVETLLVRRLQDGDEGGAMRRAMEAFPLPGVSADALRRYFRPGGRALGAPYRMLPMYRRGASLDRERITMLANFVEVWLAREGHDGLVGINLLTKVQLPNLAALYGAMLAKVDCVLMGAGIPREIPGVLDAFAEGHAASLRLEVEGLTAGREERITFDPQDHFDCPPPLPRPAFLPIVASNSLATMLARKASGRVDGFIVEGPTAGGHNAPPRGAATFNERGEPVYGERDGVDLTRLRELGLPFWLAGGAGSPAGLRAAQEAGAAGIQVGTLFAYADESGLSADIKRTVLAQVARGAIDVYTDPRASPTGYPFKVVSWPDDPASAEPPRARVCDIGGLRVPYEQPDGRIGYRCPAEPVEAFVAKGGSIEETVGRRCLCNALFANVGQAQVREDGRIEPALITSGDDLMTLGTFLRGRTSYDARAVLDYLTAAAGE
jgi:NAD(P)H-dependent flavin oxidoreductase YrpB (nitropropane dioxygenase family)